MTTADIRTLLKNGSIQLS